MLNNKVIAMIGARVKPITGFLWSAYKLRLQKDYKHAPGQDSLQQAADNVYDPAKKDELQPPHLWYFRYLEGVKDPDSRSKARVDMLPAIEENLSGLEVETHPIIAYPAAPDEKISIALKVTIQLDPPTNGMATSVQPILHWSPTGSSPEFVEVRLNVDRDGNPDIDITHYESGDSVVIAQHRFDKEYLTDQPVTLTLVIREDILDMWVNGKSIGTMTFHPLTTGPGYLTLLSQQNGNQFATVLDFHSLHIDRGPI